MPIGDILPEITLLVFAVVALLLAIFLPHRHQAWCVPVALAGTALALVLCALQLSTPSRLTFSGLWAIDTLSIWGRMLILAATMIVIVASPDWFRRDRRHGEYYAIVLLSALGAMVLAGAADLLQLVMGILLSSVTGYTLAAYHRNWALSVEAGMKYFLIGALANALLMVGVMIAFGLLGDSSYQRIAAALPATPSSPLLMLGVALLVIGIAFKLAAVPVHSWLPDVAEGAPAPAAAFLTVVPKIGAAIALARLVILFADDVEGMRTLIAALSVATMTLGNLAALWQTDVRRLLGWSSISQSGYALMAVTVVGLNASAAPALLVFLAGYAAANLAAFGVVTHLRGRTTLADYSGLAARRPWMAAAITLAMLSLVGIPPLGGFVGKLMLLLTTISADYTWLAVIAVINTVISLFYYLRVAGAMYFDAPKGAVAVMDRWSGTAVAAATASIIAVGLGAGAFLSPL